MKKHFAFYLLFIGIIFLFVNCRRSKFNNTIDKDQLYAVWHSDEYKDSLAKVLRPSVQRALTLPNSVDNRITIDSVLSILRWTNDSISFNTLCKKALKFAHRSNDKYMLASIYSNMGMYYHDINQLDSTYYYYLKSEDVYKKLADSAKIAEIGFYQARLLYEKGLFMESEVKTVQTLQILRNTPLNPVVFEANQLMALCLNKRNDFAQAKVYLLRTLESMRQDSDKYKILDKQRFGAAISALYINLSEVSYSLGQYKEASKFASHSIKYGSYFSPEIVVVFAKIAKDKAEFMAKIESNEKVNINEYTDNLYKGIELTKKINTDHFLIQFYMIGAEIYFEAGDDEKSFDFAESAYKVALRRGFKTDQKDAIEFLVTYRKYENNYLVKNLIALNRELADEEYATRNRFARIAYETERVEIENSTLKNVIYIGLIVVMSIFIVLLFGAYFVRLRSKNKEILLIKKQQKANEKIYQLILEKNNIATDVRNTVRNNIAKDIHDGVINGIFTIRFNLQQLYTDNEQLKSVLIDELQSLERRTRDISHSLMNNELFLEKDFKSVIQDLLLLQKNQWDTSFVLKYDELIVLENLPVLDKVNIYFVIIEALQNVNKYSQATVCTINIFENDQGVLFTIKDNGIGFDPNENTEGIGIKSMKDRVISLNSNLVICSQKNNGTEISFLLKVK